MSFIRFLATPFPILYQSLSSWPTSPAIIPRSFNTHVTIHLTEWSPCLRFSSLLASSVPATALQGTGLGTCHHPHHFHLQNHRCRHPLHTTSYSLASSLFPRSPASPPRTSGSLFQPQGQGLGLDSSPGPAKPVVQQFYSTSTNTLFTLPFTLFPSSGKISPMMNPTIYIQAPGS